MPARSKSQQRLFGMVHAYQKGKLKDAPEEVKRIARSISDEDAEHFAKTKHKGLPEKKAYTQSPPTLAGEKNTLLSETARAAWADLTRTRPRDRTAADLSPGQRAAFARAWSVDGDGIHRYSAYKTPVSGANSNAFSPRYWTDKDPNHQVEKLFGRGTASWSKDGDLVFNDTYDLDFGGKNLPGVPTSADPDDVKIRSRISARALGLDPKQLWETANSRIQKRWAELEPVMDKVYKDVQAGSYKGQADLAIQEAKGLQARYNRINSGPYRPEAASTLATWKDPYRRNIEEFGKNTDQMPAARIRTGRSPEPATPPSSQAPQTQPSPHVSAGYGKYSGIPDRKEKKAADRLYTYLPAEIARKELAGLFRKRQLADIVNAIAHHRASYEGTRNSRLEDLVAAADRPVPDFAKQVARSWKYHEELGEPEDLRSKNVAEHLKEKYGHGGYAYGNAPKLYLKTYGRELRNIMSKFDGLTPESVAAIIAGAEKKAAAPGTPIVASPAGTTSAKTPAPAVPYPAEGPRGFKRHNPGNLQSNGKTLWDGATGVPAKGEDLTFVDPKYGIRAMTRLAYNYKAKHGIDTPRKFLKRYAKTTDYTNYLKHIKDKTGFGADQTVDFTNVDTLQKFIPAVGSFEIGPKYWDTYSPSMVSNAVSMAVSGR